MQHGSFPSKNWCERNNAAELAKRIVNYWKVRGQIVQVRILSTYELGEGAVKAPGVTACIRSNMLGGLPPADPEAPIYPQLHGMVRP